MEQSGSSQRSPKMKLETLKEKLGELRKQEQQTLLNFNAIMGARQFCEQLIKEMEQKKSQTERKGPGRAESR